MDSMLHTLDIRPNHARSEAERQSIEDILTAAEEWSRGECSFNAVMQLGMIVNYDGHISPGRSRNVAYWTARLAGDRRHEALAQVMDISAGARMTWTRQGYFDRGDLNLLRETHMRVLDLQRFKQQQAA